MSLCAVILTRDEERHIARALASVAEVADTVLVVDSGSTDRTVEIAEAAGATVLFNPWVNYATQMNWGIARVPEGTAWIMRLDADEIVSEPLATEIRDRLPALPAETDGVYVSRRMTFMGGPVRHGGLFPIRILRLIRTDRGRCEDRWMDEHLIVHGPTADFRGEIVDDNTKSLGWWVDKHNSYASREAVDLLNLEYGFMEHETVASLQDGRQAGVKRWLKERLYRRLPGGFAPGSISCTGSYSGLVVSTGARDACSTCYRASGTATWWMPSRTRSSGTWRAKAWTRSTRSTRCWAFPCRGARADGQRSERGRWTPDVGITSRA